MLRIAFLLADGSTREVTASAGDTVMSAATRNDVPGIEALCGGCCSCATCHVYVDDAWADRLPPLSPDENDLLDGTAAERLPNSRLSCQLTMTAALDGLVVRVPQEQS